jgi:hypothetical protein
MAATFVACGTRGDVDPVLLVALAWHAREAGAASNSSSSSSTSSRSSRDGVGGGVGERQSRVRFVTHSQHAALVEERAATSGVGQALEVVLLTAAPAAVWGRCVLLWQSGPRSVHLPVCGGGGLAPSAHSCYDRTASVLARRLRPRCTRLVRGCRSCMRNIV